MKLTGFVLAFASVLFTSGIVFSQVQVLKKWTEEEGNSNAMAYFVYRDSDEGNLVELAEVISKAWTLSKVELVSIDEYLSLETKKGDFTILMGITHQVSYSQNGVASNFVDLYLDVRVQSDLRQEVLGRIALAPNGQTIFDVCRGPESLERVIYDQYKTDANFSWNYAYLSAGLAAVAEALTEGNLVEEIKEVVRNKIGRFAAPDVIHPTRGLPKTRSGKVMRRILRKIAAAEYGGLGDISTLADPSVVDELLKEHRERK